VGRIEAEVGLDGESVLAGEREAAVLEDVAPRDLHPVQNCAGVSFRVVIDRVDDPGAVVAAGPDALQGQPLVFADRQFLAEGREFDPFRLECVPTSDWGFRVVGTELRRPVRAGHAVERGLDVVDLAVRQEPVQRESRRTGDLAHEAGELRRLQEVVDDQWRSP
jgi:hypothetical protein